MLAGVPVGFGFTVTSCVAVAVLPPASVAIQVTVVVPIGKIPGASLPMVGVPQLSVPVAVPKVMVAPLHTFMSAGAVMVGNCVSATLIV